MNHKTGGAMVEGRDSGKGWLIVAGAEENDLARRLQEDVAAQIAAKRYTADEIKVIAALNLMPVRGDVELSPEALERIRRMCQFWDIDLRPLTITSHRRFIGPIIVGAKRLLFPILRAFLKDLITQQRAFNAEVISYLTFITDKSERKSSQSN